MYLTLACLFSLTLSMKGYVYTYDIKLKITFSQKRRMQELARKRINLFSFMCSIY